MNVGTQKLETQMADVDFSGLLQKLKKPTGSEATVVGERNAELEAFWKLRLHGFSKLNKYHRVMSSDWIARRKTIRKEKNALEELGEHRLNNG